MILKKLSSVGVFWQAILIVAVMLALLFSPFPETAPRQDGFEFLPVYNLLNSWIGHPGAFWSKLTGIVLIGGIGLLFNQLVLKGDLIPKKGLFIVFIYSVLMLAWGNLSFTLISFILSLLLFNTLLNILRLVSGQQGYTQVLNATISISLASLIVPQALVFMLFVWLSFFTLTISTWREWIISLIGLLTPWFYYAVFLFFTNDLVEVYTAYLHFFEGFNLKFSGYSSMEISIYAVLALIVIISIPAFISDAGERIISIRKKMWLNVHFLMIGLLALILSANSTGLWLPIVFMPVSLIVSHRVVFRRKSWILDGSVLVLFALIIGLLIGY